MPFALEPATLDDAPAIAGLRNAVAADLTEQHGKGGRRRVLPQMRLSRDGAGRLSRRVADLFRAAALIAMKVVHFPSGTAFRAWLEKHHATASELQIGFYKKAAGKPGMVYKEALDE